MPAATRVLKAGAVRVSPIEVLPDTDAVRAAAALEESRRLELEEAYRRGVADGGAQAEADGLAAAPRVAQAIERAAGELAAATAAQIATDASAIAGVAIEIARWILERELSTDVETTVARIESALAGLATTGRLEVSVAPALVDAVAKWAGSDTGVHADPALQPGEARLSSGSASADLTFDEAFRRAADAIGLEDNG
jgi:flagellar assembly protein FliH